MTVGSTARRVYQRPRSSAAGSPRGGSAPTTEAVRDRTASIGWIAPARSATEYDSGTGRSGWWIGTIGRWTRLIQSAISFTFATVAERATRSEEHTSELQSQSNLVCRLLLE